MLFVSVHELMAEALCHGGPWPQVILDLPTSLPNGPGVRDIVRRFRDRMRCCANRVTSVFPEGGVMRLYGKTRSSTIFGHACSSRAVSSSARSTHTLVVVERWRPFVAHGACHPKCSHRSRHREIHRNPCSSKYREVGCGDLLQGQH